MFSFFLFLLFFLLVFLIFIFILILYDLFKARPCVGIILIGLGKMLCWRFGLDGGYCGFGRFGVIFLRNGLLIICLCSCSLITSMLFSSTLLSHA